jgi:3-oxoacyl-[acyl-carrier-protein] synthase-3
MITRSRIIGCGSHLPRHVVSNQDLAQKVDTSDEWITQRTGIRSRHIAGPDENTSDLALAAARKAMDDAGITADQIDLIVLATTTPDHTFPATATRIQAALGMTRGMAFDLQAVCSGFVFALAVADNFIRLGQARTALVIGAETFSRILDWEDRTTCVLFGDGAGAVVLQAADSEGTSDDRGVLSTHLHSDGRYYDILWVDGGPSSTQSTGHVRMAGQEVFRQAVSRLSEVVREALDATGLKAADIDWLVPHQANKRIIDGIARKLGLPPDRVVSTVDHHGNTSAASIPLALAEAMGGGLSWGAALVRI